MDVAAVGVVWYRLNNDMYVIVGFTVFSWSVCLLLLLYPDTLT